MTGDQGDWVTGGASYTYDINQGDILRISADTTGRGVSLSITGYNGDWFDMDLKAAEGKRLEAGEYFNATRAPFSGAGPGIDIGGNGRGCNTILGHFIVIESKITDEVRKIIQPSVTSQKKIFNDHSNNNLFYLEG